MTRISYTIYSNPTTVGLTISPTPNLTLAELLQLIRDLQQIADELKAITKN